MKKIIVSLSILFLLGSCKEDFLERYPLDSPSAETFWTSAENAEMWVNNLYRSLPDESDSNIENWSDNAYCRTGENGRVIANGTFQTNSAIIQNRWDYTYIRRCLEFFTKVDEIPNVSATVKNNLVGQVRFILAFEYFKLITLFRDVPLVTKPLLISESDLPKSPKAEVLAYLLDHLDKAIQELPATWPASSNGRVTKGAALALKARVLLYNGKWSEAAETARQVMDSQVYSLHPKFGELFLKSFNNATKEVILARQYAAVVNQNELYRRYGFLGNGGYAYVLPLPDLANAFECTDGLPIQESPLYDPANPMANRDPRFAETFVYPNQNLNGYLYDPFDRSNLSGSLTYLHYRKYINDMKPIETHTHVNWIILRYADVLLMYAEAKNEASGPDATIYDALDQVRKRAGMPVVNRSKYNTQAALRALIRNERRVELAAEGLRYFDIIRWKTAEVVLNKEVFSLEVKDKLPIRTLEKRIFDPKKHYVWPIPQLAIDRAKKLEQHAEWK
ncbi:RagB/SusD family nutrient uptake outer membrane protein [Larkinella bovis]|uniref:RagB/SusD family nutrient uptake outer membrane protein n=1 Tax=Larkinella bovis TaxID=683041 RepID=A0ABW0IHW6_9BACT